jgi:lycopene cyclase
MLDRPVIIIGNGIWAKLLALQLKEQLPGLRFQLYADPHSDERQTVVFHKHDVPDAAYRWLRPMVSRHWTEHLVNFPGYQRRLEETVCLITAEELEARLTQVLSTEEYRRAPVELEVALAHGAFVIDTRNHGKFRAQGLQKTVSLRARTRGLHQLAGSVTAEARVDQKGSFRYLQLFPLDEQTLLVNDVRYSTNPQLYHDDFQQDLLEHLGSLGIEVAEVLSTETEFRKVPLEKLAPRCEHRVLRLEGILNDMTGEVLPDAVRLIERMVRTSFRYGELKEIIHRYQAERESARRLMRLMNRLLYRSSTPCDERYLFLQFFYQLPVNLRSRLMTGELAPWDLLQMLAGQARLNVRRMAGLVPLALRH